MKYNHTPPLIATYSTIMHSDIEREESHLSGWDPMINVSNVRLLVKTFLVQVLYNFLSRSLGVMGIMLRKTNVVLSN